MKNAFIAIALVLVATTAFAALDKETKSRLQKIHADPFGKTILETIQVELQSKDDPRPRIIQLLQELEQETLAEQAAADEAQADAENTHNGVVSQIQDDLATNNGNLNGWNDDQSQWEAELEQAQAALEDQTTLFNTLTSQLDAATASRDTNQQTWEAQDTHWGKIIDVLSQVKEIITQRLASRYNSEFVEKSHKQILANFAQVKESINSKAFKKASPGFSRLASFLAAKVESALNQAPTAEDTEAEAQLTSVVNLVDKILDGIREEREQARLVNENDIEQYDALAADLNQRITNARGAIDNLDTEVTDLQRNLATVADQIATAEENIATLEQQLIDENTTWDNVVAKYQDLSHARTTQVGLIEEVLDIVQNKLSGLHDYAENYIASH